MKASGQTSGRAGQQSGFSLIELMIVITLIGIITSVAVPSYRAYVKDAQAGAAISDISKLSLLVEKFALNNMAQLPDSLNEVGIESMDDPWGNPYIYHRIDGGGAGAIGDARKDKNLNPINTDFDLYSKGEDKASATPLNAASSKDDIVRALDGRFYGLAEEF